MKVSVIALVMGCIIFTRFCSIQQVHAITEYIDIPLEEDTYVEEKYPTISPWNNRNLYLGTDTWYTKGKTRVLLNINFTQLKQHPVFFSDIQAAELHAVVYGYEGVEELMTIDSYNTSTGWNMYTVNWLEQPTIITTKRDSSQITTTLGKKFIPITKAVIDAYKNERGIMLKANPETSKAIIMWAHGCEFAPTAPQCLPEENPYIRIFFTPNQLPSTCYLQTPTDNSSLSTSEIAVKAATSTDAENNPISYGARICTDTTCQQIVWQAAISATQNTLVSLAEGDYSMQCYADDGHQIITWGPSVSASVDTTAPLPPEPLELPIVSGSNEISIAWIPTEHQVLYQVQYSPRETFSAYNQYTDWSAYLSATVQNLEEKPYYFRIRSKDAALNVSEWSKTVKTTIDTTAPVFSYLKVSSTLLRPHLTATNELEGTAYIQTGFTDSTLADITVRVYDQKHTVQYTEKVSSQSYLRTHWPDKLAYPDGFYYIAAEATDALGRNLFSPVTVIELDTTPPKEPLFSGISNGHIASSKTVNFTVTCERSSMVTLYVGGKTAGEAVSSIHASVTLNDGAHAVSAKCTDKAENSSNKSISITIDTTPPAPPRFALSYDQAKRILVTTYTCRENGIMQFYSSGILRAESTCTPGTPQTSELIKFPHKSSFITITARQSDTISNWSTHSEEKIYIPPESTSTTPAVPDITCALTYNISTHQKILGGCQWHKQDTASTNRTEQLAENSYKTLLSIAPQRRYIETTVTLIACREKTFWDPRTWFTCIPDRLGEEKVVLIHTPLYRSTKTLIAEATNILSTAHDKSLTTIPISERHLIFSLATVKGYSFEINELSPAIEYALTVSYPTAKDPRAFLSWFFSKPVPVTQWHGNTAYQKPHGGIDFGVATLPITVPANGIVTSAAYHKSSECFGGGYYIGIKHDNGLYTYYFHLQSLTNQSGVPMTAGTRVNTGSPLAITGNSGMYNCEPLAHHLHFEVRTAPDPATHLNPVPYIDTDWSAIYTAGTAQNPGRLTGDNPHPTY